jgi:hypothetical protein
LLQLQNPAREDGVLLFFRSGRTRCIFRLALQRGLIDLLEPATANPTELRRACRGRRVAFRVDWAEASEHTDALGRGFRNGRFGKHRRGTVEPIIRRCCITDSWLGTWLLGIASRRRSHSTCRCGGGASGSSSG